MSTSEGTIKIAITDVEMAKSGLDPHVYLRGLAIRKAHEVSKSVAMVEYYHDETEKMHRATVYLKDKNA